MIIQEYLNQAIEYLKTPECQGWLKENNLTPIYDSCPITLKYVTQVLLNAGINPLDYLDSLYSHQFQSTDIKTVVIPSHITKIPVECFALCNNLAKVVIPCNVNKIDQEAFWGCHKLTDITFHEGLKAIAFGAFLNCDSLTNIVLPYSLTHLGQNAFTQCTQLQQITIPNVQVMEESIFSGCKALKDIFYKGTMQDWNGIDKHDNWDFNPPRFTIHCTDGDITK